MKNKFRATIQGTNQIAEAKEDEFGSSIMVEFEIQKKRWDLQIKCKTRKCSS
jgi:hypothetical protein